MVLLKCSMRNRPIGRTEETRLAFQFCAISISFASALFYGNCHHHHLFICRDCAFIMVMDTNVEKQFRVKTGVLKRAVKELEMYKKEVEEGRKKVEDMGPDHDRYKQQRMCLDESIVQVTDTSNRVQDAADDMFDFLGEHDAIVKANPDHPLVVEARKWMADAQAADDASADDEDF